MNFGALKTELYARGFSYLEQDGAGVTRAEMWLNSAYLEDLCEPYPWPDLETTTSGTMPLTIADLKDVVHVLNSTHSTQLSYADSRELADRDPAYLSTTGTPESWYLTDQGSVSVYPADTTSTFSVLYLKVPAELATGNDTPVLPSRLHPLIVDFAVVRAYLDRDNYEAAAQLKQYADQRLANLAASILWATSDPARITIAAGSGDW